MAEAPEVANQNVVPTVDDIKHRIAAKNAHVRESWIRAMETRLVKDELNKCYRGEGVNQQQNCKELAERYMRMVRDNKIQGYIVIQE